MLSALYLALGNRTGSFLASDAHVLCKSSLGQAPNWELVAHALHALGWERLRLFLDGRRQHVYAKGTSLQREIFLDISLPSTKIFTTN